MFWKMALRFHLVWGWRGLKCQVRRMGHYGVGGGGMWGARGEEAVRLGPCRHGEGFEYSLTPGKPQEDLGQGWAMQSGVQVFEALVLVLKRSLGVVGLLQVAQ